MTFGAGETSGRGGDSFRRSTTVWLQQSFKATALEESQDLWALLTNCILCCNLRKCECMIFFFQSNNELCIMIMSITVNIFWCLQYSARNICSICSVYLSLCCTEIFSHHEDQSKWAVRLPSATNVCSVAQLSSGFRKASSIWGRLARHTVP